MLTKLDELSVVLGTIDGLGDGGCGLVASIVGQKIEPYVTDLRVVILSDGDRRLDEARADAVFNGAESTDPLALIDIGRLRLTHMMLEFRVDGDWYYYDATIGLQTNIFDVYAEYDFRYDDVGQVCINEATAWANDPRVWNTEFDRSKINDIQFWTDTMMEQAA